MKKKIIFVMILLCICVGLFAYFNPLRKLPKVSEGNIFSEENETTGNDVGDEIIDMLMDAEQGVFNGTIKEFWIYDREDRGIQNSSLYVGFIAVSAQCEYTGYYIVNLDYNRDDGWEVSEVSLDSEKEQHFRPLSGADIEQSEIRRLVQPLLSSGYVVVSYPNLFGELKNFEIISDEITEDAGVYFNTISVRYGCTYGLEYMVEATVVYKYYYDFVDDCNYWYPIRCEEAHIYQVTEE